MEEKDYLTGLECGIVLGGRAGEEFKGLRGEFNMVGVVSEGGGAVFKGAGVEVMEITVLSKEL